MRSLTTLTAKRAPWTAGNPQPPAPIPTCQRDLVAWSLLVCPKPAKARA